MATKNNLQPHLLTDEFSSDTVHDKLEVCLIIKCLVRRISFFAYSRII